MKFLIVIAFSILSITHAICQDSLISPKKCFQKNSFFFEVAGSGLAYISINYERVFFHKKLFYLSGRTGFGFFGFLSIKKLISVPVTLCGILQISNVIAAEIGIGGTYAYIEQEGDDYYSNGEYLYNQYVIPVGIIGIRLQKAKGFLFRATFTPVFTYEKVYPGFGLSLGYSF